MSKIPPSLGRLIITLAIFTIFFSTKCFSGIIEVIPPNHTHVDSLFKSVFEEPPAMIPHHEPSFWDCLQYALEKKGHIVRTTMLDDIPKKRKRIDTYLPWKKLKKEVNKIFVFNLPYFLHSQKIYNLPKEKLVLFLLEPPSVNSEQYRLDKIKKHFSRIYTFDPTLVDHQQIFLFHYPVYYPSQKKALPFAEKKFLCMIAANKTSAHSFELYSKRKEAIAFFENLSDENLFDLYGYDWEKESYKNYRHVVDDKMATLANYKFSICYENMHSIPGYITEKIFDCFEAGCVPIYWGASNITDIIPKDCFIDQRDFASYEELLTFLKSMTEEQYEGYQKAILQFLSSPEAKKFSPESFIKLIVDAACS